MQPSFFLLRSAFLIFLLPSLYLPSFSFFFHSYHSVIGALVSLCGGSWLVAGIARHGSVLLSRGWLITVEGPGHPRHGPSTQLDEVVNWL